MTALTVTRPRRCHVAHWRRGVNEIPTESLLWRAVLSQAIRDIYDSNERIRKAALRWILTPDFQTVCDYAFVEPESLKGQLANLAMLPRELAIKFGRELRSGIIIDD